MAEREVLMSQDEAIAQQINKMFTENEEILKMVSDINDEEVGYMTLLNLLGSVLDLESLQGFVSNFLKFRISRERMGRKEVVWMTNSIQAMLAAGARGGKTKAKDLFAGFG